MQPMLLEKKAKQRDVPGITQYAGFHSRTIASLIDCLLIGILFLPFFAIMSHFIYGNHLPSEIIDNLIKEITELNKNKVSVDMAEYIKNNKEFNDYFFTQHGLIKVILDQTIQFSILAFTLLIFWIKKQATPGKKFLSLKIVDAQTLGKPSNKQLIIRLFGYLISVLPLFLGIIWIALDPKKQGWHDKIAKTLVIKEKK